MNKIEKRQNSVGLFKIKAHPKYSQGVAKSNLCPMLLYVVLSLPSAPPPISSKYLD